MRFALDFYRKIRQRIGQKKKIKIKIFTPIGDNSVNDLRFIKRELRSKYLDHIPLNLKATTIIIRFSKREQQEKLVSRSAKCGIREISRQRDHFSRRNIRLFHSSQARNCFSKYNRKATCSLLVFLQMIEEQIDHSVSKWEVRANIPPLFNWSTTTG